MTLKKLPMCGLGVGVMWAVIFLGVCVSQLRGAVEEKNVSVVKREDPSEKENGSAFKTWWEGNGVTGDWLGARKTLDDHGVKLRGAWVGVYFGILTSESGSASSLSQHLALGSTVDFAKVTGWEGLKGLTGFVDGRWREPGYDANPNNYVEAAALFNPSRFSGGTGWRLLGFGLTYKTPELFGRKDFLEVTGGWLQPQREFVNQPLAQNYAINNAIGSALGLGGNIPFSASFSTWGGTLQVKPTDWSYTKLGLFMSYPEAAATQNNGLMFRGYAPDISQNGLFFMGETGVKPKIGESKLEGKYAFGSYYYEEDTVRTGTSKYAFYWQADQMLYREASGESGKLSDQGLRAFSLWVLTPNTYNVNYPFYAHGGLAYEGLVPSRDHDHLIAMAAVANYSERSIQQAQKHNAAEPTTTVFFETSYRVKVNGWSYVQPFFQYIVQPNGSTAIANSAILGVAMGVVF